MVKTKQRMHSYWSFSEWRCGKRGSERVNQQLSVVRPEKVDYVLWLCLTSWPTALTVPGRLTDTPIGPFVDLPWLQLDLHI